MLTDIEDVFSCVIRKLEQLVDLDRADRAAIAGLPFRKEAVSAGHHLVHEGAVVEQCCILLSGYASRYKTSGSGARQIVSFHMAGDILDLQHLLFSRADHSIQTISAATVAWVSVESLRALSHQRPAIGEGLWRDTLIDASIFREWVLNVGQREAKSRIAHMLCEFAIRREAAGLGGPENLELPMTQQQIAEATGITAVHVNRMLQLLRLEGLIQRDGRTFSICDWNRMRQVADFDPDYLHLAA